MMNTDEENNSADETKEYSVKKCPYCAEEINIEAIKCKHCGEKLGKGYEIDADGTYVSNKEETYGQWSGSNQSESNQSGNLFVKVVWVTLLVIFIITVVQFAACAAIFS